jgi:enterobactin synthetase component D
VPAAPSPRLTGDPRPLWTPAEVAGCPFGALVCAICPGEVPDALLRTLEPAEREHAETLEPFARRREWIAGRLCLAQAIARFTAIRAAMLPDASGAPTVPEGLAGSISHKGPLALALAAKTLGGVGVDIECVENSDTALERKVLTARERAGFGDRDGFSAALYVVTHFAMKEAIYKALRASEQSEVDFDTIELEIPPLSAQTWLLATAKLHVLPSTVRAAVLLDGEWVIAVARRA